MRPSVQKTLLVALGAAIASSALGLSGDGIGATDRAPAVKIVVLPGQSPRTDAATSDVSRLIERARLARLLRESTVAAPAAPAASDEEARAELVERARQRLRATLRQARL